MRSLILIAMLSAGCGADLSDTDLVQLDEEKSDGELYARSSGLSVWVDSNLRAVTREGRQLWVLEGRASKNLREVFSFVPDDPFCSARTLSARRFEIACDAAHEINSVLSGMPLFVRLTPLSGATGFAALWLAPRFAGFSGSARISVSTPILRVWYGGELVYRARASLSTGNRGLVINGHPADEERPRKFRADFSFDALSRALAASVRFITHDDQNGKQYEKRASIELRASQLGLTTRDPGEVWPSQCEPRVQRCLAALPAGTLDGEACGSYRQVQRCGGIASTIAEPSRAEVAQALRDHLVGWYQTHAADVARLNGRSLAEAQAAVDANAFRRIERIDEELNGYDPSLFWSYQHLDVVFPGSDIVWSVVFERASGDLVEVYDFN